MLFQKTFMKEFISVALSLSLLAKNLSSVVLKNWFIVSKKSGNFCYPDKWQPCESSFPHVLIKRRRHICTGLLSRRNSWNQNEARLCSYMATLPLKKSFGVARYFSETSPREK